MYNVQYVHHVHLQYVLCPRENKSEREQAHLILCNSTEIGDYKQCVSPLSSCQAYVIWGKDTSQ